jgi:pimeloyl-ACP methyl ester carboxylesterase
MTMPCLLFAGELDPRLAKVKECVSELPSAKCFTLPECDHFDALVRSDLVIPHIKAFLSKVGPCSARSMSPIGTFRT